MGGTRSSIWRGAYADQGHNPLPALILLHLNLPVVSGFEVLRWLSGRAEFKGLPVVVTSSSAHEEDKVKARELGARDVIEKPSSTEGLNAVVQGLKERWLREAMVGGR